MPIWIWPVTHVNLVDYIRKRGKLLFLLQMKVFNPRNASDKEALSIGADIFR